MTRRGYCGVCRHYYLGHACPDCALEGRRVLTFEDPAEAAAWARLLGARQGTERAFRLLAGARVGLPAFLGFRPLPVAVAARRYEAAKAAEMDALDAWLGVCPAHAAGADGEA